jgi:hypothetical protein
VEIRNPRHPILEKLFPEKEFEEVQQSTGPVTYPVDTPIEFRMHAEKEAETGGKSNP